jgi:lipoprotein Spr
MNPRIMKSLAGMALGLTIVATGTVAVGPAPAHAAAAAATSTTAANVIATGQKYLGVPYQWGATSGRTDRFDCSSFVQFAFAQNGISLPRSSRQQSVVGTFVPRDQLQPGDLIFFYAPIHHVAIYMGNGKILHTYGAPGVTVSDLAGSWSSRYTTARRVLPTGQAAPTAPVYTAPATAPAQNTAPVYSAPAHDTAPVYSAPAQDTAPSADGYAPTTSKKRTTHHHYYHHRYTSHDNNNESGHQD